MLKYLIVITLAIAPFTTILDSVSWTFNGYRGIIDSPIFLRVLDNILLVFKAYLNVKIIYGDLEIDYGTFKRAELAKPLANIWKGMVFSHQSSFINNIISIMDVEGLSDGNRFKSTYQHHKIVNDSNFSIRYNLYYLYKYFNQLVRKWIKSILPDNVVNYIKSKGLH